ncbi:MAG: bifunctional 4-hydroxy-2-oxoglutarate aldolase/2-dehydro-3-deoxy-phosphogluconate aldolase [Ruminococcaceae bacterium]|nr:bifunctional 4-hydroxy-2-oxoglutarate aldolase/2-dehydro-3-deoxy-phosphogluconate aldolase [Oscillospiraceae bacterium]
MDILKELSLIGIVPVVRLDRIEDAVPLAGALMEGGLPCAEVTFRTAAAAQAIAEMCRAYPDMLVGAGTVLTTAQVDAAVAAGAKFIVSPGFNAEVVRYCIDRGIPVVPGINNPTGIEAALTMGIKTVKFFPAEPSGGVKMIKAMAAPYGDVTFMPTGGIDAKNLGEYLAFPKILACGGSWMVSPELIKAGDFSEITRLTREAVDTMLGFELRHVGVNCASEGEADASAACLKTLFSFPTDKREISSFAGTGFELMNEKGMGTMGHIAIRTASVERAVYHLSRRGAKFLPETAKYDKNGKLFFIYLADEIAGFAYHLVG